MLPPAEAPPLLRALATPTAGRRAVANRLRSVAGLAPGHPAGYRRVLPAAEWSGPAPGCTATGFPLTHRVPDGPVALAGGDAAGGHPGRPVYGWGRHRAAVRSSHGYAAWGYGHRRVVPALPMRLPLPHRRWASPVLADLYRAPEISRAEGVRRRAPCAGRSECCRPGSPTGRSRSPGVPGTAPARWSGSAAAAAG